MSFESLDEGFFLSRGNASENIVSFDEFIVVDGGFYGGEIDGLGIFEADLGGDFGDGGLVVTRDDFDGDVVFVEIVDDVFGVFSELVFE